MKDVEGWALVTVESAGDRIDALRKELKFKNFRSAMSYLRAVEAIAETEAHHPDFCVHYNKVTFTLWTHAIAGLHENDFILAAKIDNLREVFQAAH
jgi:4a-hydroxytetrahydrobiopterin dehydratase